MQTDQSFLASFLLVRGHPLLKITQGPRGAILHFPDDARKEIEPFTCGAEAPALELLQTYRRLVRQINETLPRVSREVPRG